MSREMVIINYSMLFGHIDENISVTGLVLRDVGNRYYPVANGQ